MLRTFLLVLLLAGSVSAQCTQKVATLPAAPELFGFHLGMTKDEIKQLVPQTVFPRTDHFGVAKTTINPHFDPKIDQVKYEGVRSISLDLVDDTYGLTVTTVVVKPKSRGFVRLRSADPSDMPLVSPVVRATIEPKADRVRVGLNLVGGARAVPHAREDVNW